MASNRREFILAISMALIGGRAFAQYRIDSPLYRGYQIDMSAIAHAFEARRGEIVASVRHQIDIAADCGAQQSVLDFFQSQKIFVRRVAGDGGGGFAPGRNSVFINAAVLPPQSPVLLHELLHAYHAKVLPGGFNNRDILRFYNNAKTAQRSKVDAYGLKDQREFFAVTASLYLWGHLDRPPFERATLKTLQPAYYAWLGNLFGVRK